MRFNWRGFWKAILASSGPIAVLAKVAEVDGNVTAGEWATVGFAAVSVLAVLFGPANKAPDESGET